MQSYGGRQTSLPIPIQHICTHTHYTDTTHALYIHTHCTHYAYLTLHKPQTYITHTTYIYSTYRYIPHIPHESIHRTCYIYIDAPHTRPHRALLWCTH